MEALRLNLAIFTAIFLFEIKLSIYIELHSVMKLS